MNAGHPGDPEPPRLKLHWHINGSSIPFGQDNSELTGDVMQKTGTA
jgi:hypothetical protein